MVSSWRKAFVATDLYNATQVMVDGPVMLARTPQAICRIELRRNGLVAFDYATEDKETKFEATEAWATRVLGYLADFYKEQQQDQMRAFTVDQQEDAIRGRESAAKGVEVSPTMPHCYLCAEEGHIREMRLVMKTAMWSTTGWDKPWSPMQGCLQCDRCGRLTCWTHSDNRKPCKCGATDWIERRYLQMELDNG